MFAYRNVPLSILFTTVDTYTARRTPPTIGVSHFLFPLSHIGKVIDNGICKIFQSFQLYFHGFEFFGFGNLHMNMKSKEENEDKQQMFSTEITIYSTTAHVTTDRI